jgi:Domain of unknown function (DUF4145)
MSTIVRNCPRCQSSRMTHDVRAQQYRGSEHGWLNHYEIYCVCRACSNGTVFFVAMKNYDKRDLYYADNAIVSYKGDLTNDFKDVGYLSLKDEKSSEPPENLPEAIANAYAEGSTCYAVKAYNAAGTMFRLCLDLATKPLLPAKEGTDLPQPNEKQRRDLGLRLAWLFDNKVLPESFRELAKCVREDANDGAHVGSLSNEDAEDLQEFTFALLDRLISEKERIRKAEERRAARRGQPSG